MKLYKVVNIDLETERARIERIDYTAKERKYLFHILDLFEAGEFKKALLYANKFPKEYREYIAPEVFDILWSVCMGDTFIAESKMQNAKKD